MKLRIREPFSDLFSLENEMRDVFGAETDERSTWKPAVDISEVDETIKIEADVPGVEKDDIQVSIEDNNLLTITGNRGLEDEVEEDFHQRERCCGKFRRGIYLPQDVNTDKIKAEYNNGVLTITVPRMKKTEVSTSVDIK